MYMWIQSWVKYKKCSTAANTKPLHSPVNLRLHSACVVAFVLRRGVGVGMSPAGTVRVAVSRELNAEWWSVCVQFDEQAKMGGKVGLICCWTRELWRSKCNFLCICYLFLFKCCSVCLVRVSVVIKSTQKASVLYNCSRRMIWMYSF